MARRRARELAFQALFQAERGATPVLEVWDELRQEVLDATRGHRESELEEAYGDRLDAEGLAFAEHLLSSFERNRERVDRLLQEVVEGWSFPQMAQTDLNILRLALTEVLFEPDVPPEVTIEMAVRTAKKYGGEDSGRFVNGVLARALKKLAATAG